jgi:hypothetical protein
MSGSAGAFLAAARNAVLIALRQHDLVTATVALERLSTLRDATGGAPIQQARAQAELADLWSLLRDYARARSHYDRAISLSPSESRYWFNRAAVLRFLGELAAAERDYDEALRLAPDDAQAYLHRSELRVQSADRNHLPQLEAALAAARGVWQREVPLRYALAKEYEDLGEHAHAWPHLAVGAALRRRHLQYNPRVDLDTAEWISAAYPASVAFSGGCASDEPIFIIGMPRTGSTLVDRILSSHSQVYSAGELADFSAAVVAAVQRLLGRDAPRQELIAASAELDFTALGEDYLRRTRPRTGKTPRFTDKLPINYLYAGMIARALPNARIVHVMRDPVATCYGIFKVLFEQGYPFSYDLIELADYYAAYHRLMTHWRRALPGRIIDFSYEELVASPATQAPQLLHAVGLTWQPACLEFHRNLSPVATASAAQVRRPIYSSAVAQWRHYECELQPLIARLKAAGVPMSD